MLLATTLLALYLTAFVTSYRGLEGNDVIVFWIGCAAGAVGSLISFVASWRSAQRVGARKIRLATPVDWWGLAVIQLCILLFACLFVVPALFLAGPIGAETVVCAIAIGWTVSLAHALIAVIRPRLDLCEYGVLIGLVTWVPWGDLRVHMWDREDSGRLELRSLLLRTVAFVPEKLRDDVTALLKQKVRPISAEKLREYLEDRDPRR